MTDQAAQAAIDQACRALRLPTIRGVVDDTVAAAELAELLGFLADWLDSADSDILDASLQRFAHAAYGRTDLPADLARLAFVLGADGSRLFGDTV